MRRAFRNWFGEGLLPHYYSAGRGGDPELRDLDSLARSGMYKRGICLYGHFNRSRGFGVEQYYPWIEQMITIVRDPFEQHVSQYYFTKRKISEGKEGLPLVKAVGGDPGDLESYVRNRRSCLLSYLPEGLDADNYREVLAERYLFVGIAERMNDSVDRISELLGMSAARVPVKNASERAGGVDLAKLREVFMERNRLEMAIYEECLQLFHRHGDSFGWRRLARSLRRAFRR